MSPMLARSAFLIVQAVVIAAFCAAWAASTPQSRALLQREILGREVFWTVPVPRTTPLVVEPLYDRPDFVSDEELEAVLDRVVPRFDRRKTSPNVVEHAVRIWGVNARFDDPHAMSGAELAELLTDHAKYAASWGTETAPLIQERTAGVGIRWGKEIGASAHHDHWLASLTEGGIHADTPVYGPGRYGSTINDVLQEALRDFRLEEPEVEWTAMAFGLWLPPGREWIGGDGRHYSFDLLTRRLVRGHQRTGACSGTHRCYSLMLLVRLDDEFDILSEGARAQAMAYLRQVRDLLNASQLADGRWPGSWAEGAAAPPDADHNSLIMDVVATGHHLEWLALAPSELHPPEESIRKAIRWIVDITTRQSAEEILPNYTYYSHVGNALALWRGIHPAQFWSGRKSQRE